MHTEDLRAEAEARLARGDWRGAGAVGLRILQSVPGSPDALFVIGAAALRLRQIGTALDCLQRASEAAPMRSDIHAELARAHVTAGNLTAAVASADRVMALGVEKATVADMVGVVYGQAGLHRKARHAFRAAVASDPANGYFRFNLASTLAFDGELAAAEEQLEQCIALEPRHWRAHYLLSHMRKQNADRNHVDRLLALLGSDSDPEARFYLNLALSKEFEDQEGYGLAFRHLTAGKAAGAVGRSDSGSRDAAIFANIQRCLHACANVRAGGLDTDEPIFVIGMPRTGTTLVDRILSSHPDVASVGEQRSFLLAFHRALGGAPDLLVDPNLPTLVQSAPWRAIAGDYLENSRVAADGARRFVDKTPHNFLYAGFIAAAFPRAKIICLRRNPMDTCLSNFRQVFALDSPYFDYSFDLARTGRYYILFDQLIAALKRTLPGRMLEVEYESLVNDQAGQTKNLLEFCDLPWHEDCLHFEANAAPVATASVVQVRQPMNSAAVGRWRRYGAELDGLRQMLLAAGLPVHG